MPLISEDFVRRYKLPFGRGQAELRDTKLTGFWLRVRRRADGSLAKAYFIDHLVTLGDGRKVRRKLSIGDAGTYHADKARGEAQRMLQSVKRGDDPAAERAARKARPTFETLFERYREKRLSRRKIATQKDYEGRIRRVLMPYFRGRFVDDITTAMVIDCHHRKSAHPVDANRSVAVLSAMMKFAVAEGMRADNPCRAVERYRETARDRWLDEDELPRFIEALAAIDSPIGDLLRFMTVSGWRISEARLLHWNDVDLGRLVARLSDTKTGAQDRQLSADAALLIDRQPYRSGFVFTCSNGRLPLDYRRVRNTLGEVCDRARVPRITPHALRHTAATWAAMAGATAHELREAGGWKTLVMANRYVSRAETLGRSGAEKAAGAINIFGRPLAEVRRLRP